MYHILFILSITYTYTFTGSSALKTVLD